MHVNEYVKATGLNTVFVFAIMMITPILAPYIKSLGFDNIQISLLFSVMPLAIIFSAPIIGKLSDDIGRRKVILAGIAVEIIAFMIYAYAVNGVMIVVARILDAIAATTVMMAVLAKVEDTLSNKTRGTYAGLSLSVEYIGRILGPVVGGLLADYIFIRAPFFAASLILMMLFLFIPKHKTDKIHITKKEFDLVNEIKQFLSYRQLKGMAILGMVMHATFPAFTIFLPILIVEKLNLSYAYVGYAFLIFGSTHILQFVFGKLANKKSYRIVLAGTFISGLFMAFMYGANSYIMILLLLFFGGLGNSMWNVSAWTLMSDIGEINKIEGSVIGAYISIAKIGAFLSFLVSGFVVQYFGINTLFLFNGVLIVIGTIVAYPLVKYE